MYTDSNGKKWYKGNIHTHTTLSDGRVTPAESARLYRENGYDFLAFTDHWHVSENDTTDDGLLLLSGCEYDTGRDVRDGIFHVTSLGCTEMPKLERGADAKTIVDEIHRCGGIANLAHPAWSMNTCEQLMPTVDGKTLPLFGADVTEIYNSVSGLPRNCRPYSGIVIDQLAARGVFPGLVADDDTHWYGSEACMSYIMVQADECTREAILSAIRVGSFYSTQAPTFEITRDGDLLHVSCSPASSVVYYTDVVWCGHRADVGEGIVSSDFRFTNESYVRIEITDSDGKTAWSNCIMR